MNLSLGFGLNKHRVQQGALLNQPPVVPDGTPTSILNVTDVSFDVISSVATNSSTVVELEYGTVSGVYTNTVTAAESPVSVTGDVNFSLTGLTPFTTYFFRVKATNDAGTSHSIGYSQKTLEPAIISDGNTVAWYDFAIGITKDGSNFVSAWNSRIGTNHLVQATGTNQPLHTATGVLFDGVDNFMKTAAFTFNQPEMVYLVINQKTHTDQDTFFDGVLSNRGRFKQVSPSPSIAQMAGADSSSNPNLTINTFAIIKVLFDGLSSFTQVNLTSKVVSNAGTNAMGGITIGSRGGADTAFANVEFKEAIFRKVADNSTDETSIYNYLKTKYAL